MLTFVKRPTSSRASVLPLLTALVALLALLALLVSVSTIPAHASAKVGSTPGRNAGLYGSQDPTYDGVYRQSLAILGLHAARAKQQPAAITWLLRQQCATGQWESFRPAISKRCTPAKADSNATAMAVMALAALGKTRAARQGVRWLRAHQLPGGGWEYSLGWGADANSTALAIQALLAVGVRPTKVTSNGKTGFGFLRSLQLRCSSVASSRGSLDYQVESPLSPNDYATVQAAQAFAKVTPLVNPVRRGQWRPTPVIGCDGSGSGLAKKPRDAAFAYLRARLAANSDAIPSAFGPGIDVGSTVNAVLALVGRSVSRSQVRQTMVVVNNQARSFALDASKATVPAAAALLILAEHATSGDPRDVGGLDLINRIRASIRA